MSELGVDAEFADGGCERLGDANYDIKGYIPRASPRASPHHNR